MCWGYFCWEVEMMIGGGCVWEVGWNIYRRDVENWEVEKWVSLSKRIRGSAYWQYAPGKRPLSKCCSSSGTSFMLGFVVWKVSCDHWFGILSVVKFCSNHGLRILDAKLSSLFYFKTSFQQLKSLCIKLNCIWGKCLAFQNQFYSG